MQRKLVCDLVKRVSCRSAFRCEGIQERYAFVAHSNALCAREHVAGAGRIDDAIGYAHHVFGSNRLGKRLARLFFRTMSLVDHPVPDGRKQPAVRNDVAEQEAVVGNDDIRRFGAAACPVHDAACPKIGTFTLQAIGA